MTLANQKSTGPTIEPPHDARGNYINALLNMDLNVVSCRKFRAEAQIYAHGSPEEIERAIMAIPQTCLKYCCLICLDFGEHEPSDFFDQECEVPITDEEIMAQDPEQHVKGLRRVTGYLYRTADLDLVIKVLWGCTPVSREGDENSCGCFRASDRHFCEAGRTLGEYRQFQKRFYGYEFGSNIHLLTRVD
jgi:hypothetical protein